MMEKQISIDELLKPEPEKIELPVAVDGEKVYLIPEDVWRDRCRHCVHKVAEKNWPVPLWAVYKNRYDNLKPCRIMSIAKFDRMPGECLSFAPRHNVYGICETCEHNNQFHEGFCMKDNHADEHRVCYGGNFGGDAKNLDYWGRHRFSVCDDYDPRTGATEVIKRCADG